MSLLKGDDLRTVFVEAANVRTNVLVASQVDAVINGTAVTGSLSLTAFGQQPQNYGSVVGVFTGLNVKGVNGYAGQVLSFASAFANSVTSFPISHLGPVEALAVKLAPISGISGSSVGGQLLCVGPGDWRLLSTVGAISQ